LDRKERNSESTTSLDLDDANERRREMEVEAAQYTGGCVQQNIIDVETKVEDGEESPALHSQPTSSSAAQVQPRDTYFTEFVFSPACPIRLDYVGKRVKTDQGAFIGLLVGLADLHRTELVLRELHNPRGMLGLNRCVQYALDEWIQVFLTILAPKSFLSH